MHLMVNYIHVSLIYPYIGINIQGSQSIEGEKTNIVSDSGMQNLAFLAQTCRYVTLHEPVTLQMEILVSKLAGYTVFVCKAWYGHFCIGERKCREYMTVIQDWES